MTTFADLIAMADMSRTPYAIATLLVIGFVILRLIRPADSTSRNWIPIVAFVSGPIIALGYFAADIFLVSRDYITFDDYIESMIPILIIGIVGGTIGAIWFWLGNRINLKHMLDTGSNDQLDNPK